MVFVNTIMETIVESALIEAVTPDSCSNETNSQKNQETKKGLRRSLLIIVIIILIVSILSTLGLIELDFDCMSKGKSKHAFESILFNSTSNTLILRSE